MDDVTKRIVQQLMKQQMQEDEDAPLGGRETPPQMSARPMYDALSGGVDTAYGGSIAALGGGIAGGLSGVTGGASVPIGVLMALYGIGQGANGIVKSTRAIQQMRGSHPQQIENQYWEDELNKARGPYLK